MKKFLGWLLPPLFWFGLWYILYMTGFITQDVLNLFVLFSLILIVFTNNITNDRFKKLRG